MSDRSKEWTYNKFQNKSDGSSTIATLLYFKECSYVFMIKVTYAHHRKFGNHRKERNICPNSPISGKTLLNIIV